MISDALLQQYLEKTYLRPRRVFIITCDYPTTKVFAFSDHCGSYNINGVQTQVEDYILNMGMLAVAMDNFGRGSSDNITLRMRNEPYPGYSYLSRAFAAFPIENSKFEAYDLYLSDTDTSTVTIDKSLKVWEGRCQEPTNFDSRSNVFDVLVTGKEQYFERKQALKLIDVSTYPYADPDDIGSPEPLWYGVQKLVRMPCIIAGGRTTVVDDPLTTSATTLNASLADNETPFQSATPNILIDDEQCHVSSKGTGKNWTITRAQNGTAASEHAKGAAIREVLTNFTFLAMKNTMKSMDEVYIKYNGSFVRLTTGYTLYNGNHPTWPGKAIVVLSSDFARVNNLDVSTGSHEHNSTTWSGTGSRTSATVWTASPSPGWTTNQHTGSAFIDSAGNYFYIHSNTANALTMYSIEARAIATGSYVGTIVGTSIETVMQNAVTGKLNAPSSGTEFALCDGAFDYVANIITAGGYIDTARQFALSMQGKIIGAKLCSAIGGGAYSGTGSSTIQGGLFSGSSVSGGGTTMVKYKTVTTLQRSTAGAVAWSDFSSMAIRAAFVSGTAAASFHEHWVEVYYIPATGGSSPATGVSLTGNSALDAILPDGLYLSGSGNYDDLSGTYTGVASALIENPSDTIKHLLVDGFGENIANVDTASFGAARTAFASAVYKFGFLVDQAKASFSRLMWGDWGSWGLAKQCASDLINKNGMWYLIPDPASPADALGFPLDGTNCKYRTFSKTGVENVKNELYGYYNRDLTKSGKLSDMYRGIEKASDTTSQSQYKGTFQALMELWAVYLQPHAAALVAWALPKAKDTKWQGEAFVTDHLARKLRQGDYVNVVFAQNWDGSKMFKVLRVQSQKSGVVLSLFEK